MLTRSLRAVLYEIRRSDPVTFLDVVLVFPAVSLPASWPPARRALKIDPTTALRAD